MRSLSLHIKINKLLDYSKKIQTKNNKLPKIVKFNKSYLNNVDIVFTALPNGEAQLLSKHLLPKNRLIDLAADFRLHDHKEYKKWYKINHKAVKNISNSIYAIPEISKKYLKNYNLLLFKLNNCLRNQSIITKYFTLFIILITRQYFYLIFFQNFYHYQGLLHSDRREN